MAYTTIDNPAEHFQPVIWTGNGTDDRAINIGMQPDFVWWKHRTSSSYWHYLVDSSRGRGNQIYANGNNAEGTHSGGHVKSYTSTGITIDDDQAINHGSTTYASWMWKANGGTRVTFTESGANPAGGYQANTTAGFSIVQWTGDGGQSTVGHGLSNTPKLVIQKDLDSTSDWSIFDIKREGYNVDNDELHANDGDAEGTADMIDIYSNGFKSRIATDPNVAETYVFMAMADNPFKYATAR